MPTEIAVNYFTASPVIGSILNKQKKREGLDVRRGVTVKSV